MTRLTKSSYIKITLVCLLCLVICGTLVGGFAAAGNALNRWKGAWDDRSQSWIAESNSGAFSVNASEISSIDISWLAGKVTVQTVDDAQTDGLIQVTETEGGKPVMRWRNADGRLEIDYGNIMGMAGCILHPFARNGKDLTVLIPQSQADKLEAFNMDAASGDHSLSGLSCKNLSINQASGNIHVSDFCTENIGLSLASGSFSFDGKINGRIDMEQASGRSTIALHGSNPSECNMSLASGDLQFMLPQPDFCIQLTKMSGNFSSEYELTMTMDGDTYYSGAAKSHHKDSSQHYTEIDMSMMSGKFTIGKSA